MEEEVIKELGEIIEDVSLKIDFPLVIEGIKLEEPPSPNINEYSKIFPKYKAVVEQLEGLIIWAARRFLFVIKKINHKFSYLDVDDVKQEMKMWMWRICSNNADKPIEELIKISKTLIFRWTGCHLRKANLKKNKGVSLALNEYENADEAFDNITWKQNKTRYENKTVSKLDLDFIKIKFYEHLVATNTGEIEVKIFKLIAFPEKDPEFLTFCDGQNALKKRKHRNSMSQTNLAHYLGVNNCTLHNKLKVLRVEYKEYIKGKFFEL